MTPSNHLPLVAVMFAALQVQTAPAQCVSLTGGAGLTYTQNFDALATSGTTNILGTALPGWFLNETGGGARDNEQYAADTGSGNTGDTYSYATAAAPAN